MYYTSNELCHYGLKGMKWGTRRWQFQDGKFNDAGKARYFGQNSSHRPNSVRVLQGDSPKVKNSQARADHASGKTSSRSFDKEKAKKIAKGVAIGTAIVGGTVLAAYGAKKVHDLGGVSKIAQDVVAKHRGVKLENIEAAEKFKSDKAQIRLKGKEDRASMLENAKAKINEIRNEGKEASAKAKEDRARIAEDAKSKMNEIRNEGKDARAKANDDLKRTLSERKESTKTDLTKLREDAKTAREKIKFDADLERRMNRLDPEGKVDRNILRKELIRMNASEASMRAQGAAGGREGRRLADNYTRYTRSKIQSEIANMSPAELKRLNSGEASFLDLRKERGMSSSPSQRMISNRTPSDRIPFSKNTKISPSNAKTTKIKSTAQIVSEYKREHPATKLSNAQIIKNYSGESKKSSGSSKSKAKMPKLTLVPETIQAGTQFMSEFNKTLQTFKTTNKEQEKKAKRGAKAVDDYTNSLLRG